MPRGSRPPSRADKLEQLRAKLRVAHNELYDARVALIDLMPEAANKLLEAHWRVEDWEDLEAWSCWAVDGLLALADKRHGPDVGSAIGQWRANCPLCGREALTLYARGFAHPIGLTRHLEGSHKVHQCRVFKAAFNLATEAVLDLEDPTSPTLRFQGKGFERPPKPWLQPAIPSPTSQPSTVIQLRPAPADPPSAN